MKAPMRSSVGCGFHIIGSECGAVRSAPAQHPVPIHRGHDDRFLAVPRQWLRPSLAGERIGDVAPIADDVEEERVGNGLLDFAHIEEMSGRGFRPAAGILLQRHVLHDDAQKVAAVPAPGHQLGPDIAGLESRELMEIAFQPVLYQPFAVSRVREIAVARDERVEDPGLAAEDREISRRQQAVEQQRRSRTRRTDGKNRSLFPIETGRGNVYRCHHAAANGIWALSIKNPDAPQPAYGRRRCRQRCDCSRRKRFPRIRPGSGDR